jgi:cytochrome c-type biogenesis protein CcmH/NrfG
MQKQALMLHEEEHQQDMNKKRKYLWAHPTRQRPKKYRDHLTEEEEEEEEEAAAAEEEEKKERSRERNFSQVSNSSNKTKWGELLVLLLLVISTLEFSVLGIENLKLGAAS